MQVFDDRFQAESGWNRSSILTLLGSGHKKNCTKHTSAECRVENSWWRAQKTPETCRVL